MAPAATVDLLPTQTAVQALKIPATNTPVLAPASSPTMLATCPEQGKVESGSYTSPLNETNQFRIYLPPCYGMDGHTYPTIYLLPGNGQDETVWEWLGVGETAELAIAGNQIPPLLIVMADGGWLAQNTSGGPGSYESLILNDLIPAIESNYCAWPSGKGRALGGISRGGYWALEIAFRHADSFASVGGHSASLLDIAAGPDLNPQVTALTNNLGDLRIYLDIGRKDGAVANLLQLHEEMDAKNVAHTWQFNDGGHDEVYWRMHISEYLSWYTLAWPLARSAYPVC